ncbi:mis18-binding protein 1 isoform X2 [Archocentrus centrarchus]|uniref:mis18-binding protein 1 isoform X2 n=1 Tax=Archocentrus centrarchus TaxID=63155 RepID=UPI0011E9CE70|nr:mis18-binding protein 1 isoform X2 [Archocentrus centrarchus]
MASHLHLLQHTKPQLKSPAKIFARLKSKVQKEAMCAKNGIDPSNIVREQLGAELNSPRKKKQRIWMTEELDENQRFGSEAQPLTLSPIKSPQTNSLYSYSDFIRKPLEEMGPGYTRREKSLLESTAVSHTHFLTNQIHKDSPKVSDLDRFIMSSRTPQKLQPVDSDRRKTVSDEECAPLHKPVSPASVYSPMVKRLRKRKWEQQEFNKVSSSTKEVRNEGACHPQERKAPAFSENTHSISVNIRGYSADRPDVIHEAMFSKRKSIAETRCGGVLEKIPIMSPAKVFAYMKARESKRELQEVHKIRRDLFNADNFLQFGDNHLSTPHSVSEREDSVFTNTPESEVPVNQRVSELTDCQSATDPSENTPSSPASLEPVLLEDPLVLNSPQISIPKNQEAVFKRNKSPKQAKFPRESVIYLKKWFLRKTCKGLFVDGICSEDNIPWNSNIIVNRVSNSVIKTVTGKVYILVGKMKLNVESDFPRWFLKKFEKGFPPNWKVLYEKMLTESRDNRSTGRERSSEQRGIKSKQKSQASHIKSSVKQHRQESFKTPESCPPISSAFSSMKVSRSGRVIKPPLEYWKGGRVILDAFMNVTIHKCYDRAICNPVNTTVSARTSQEPVHATLPCSEGEKEASVPLRRVKAPLHRRNRVETNPDDKPSDSLEPVAEPLGSPKKRAGRIMRSGQRCPAKERELHMGAVPKQQSDNGKSSAKRPQKQSQSSCRASAKLTKSKQTVINSPESPPVKILQPLASDDELSNTRKKRGKGGYSKNSRNAHKKSHSKHKSSSSKSLESFEEQKGNKEYSAQKSQKHRSHGTRRPLARATTRKQTVINSPESPPVNDEISQHLSSEDELLMRRKKRGKGGYSKNSRNAHEKSHSKHKSSSSKSSECFEEQKGNKEYSAQKSQKHRSHGTRRPLARATTRKQTVINSPESPPVNDEISQHLSSEDELLMRRKKRGKGVYSNNSKNACIKSQPKHVSSSNKSEDSGYLTRRKQKQKSSKCAKAPAKPSPEPTQPSKKPGTKKSNTQQEHYEDKWTEAELMRLQEAVSFYTKHVANYWAKVARMVGTRSAEECNSQHTSRAASHTAAKKATRPKKEKVEPPKAPDHPVISARVGTLKRKQQVRQFLETMPREDVDDVFSSAYMQNKCFELPSFHSDDEEHLAVSNLGALTPMSTLLPEVKTPQCLHITPGMMGSPNRDNDDKYVYQLQKRIKKHQFNAFKDPPPLKSFTPTPSVKRTMRRCGNTENDTFVVWEMFPGNDEALSESGEEEDFYFSDNN